MDPKRSSADLIVYLDVKSPYAYLSIEPTLALVRDFEIEIDWRPLTLNIPSFLGSARADESGKVIESQRTPRQWQSVRYAYMDAKRYARRRDILLYGPRKIWDTSLVHISWLYVQRYAPELSGAYRDTVFSEFWKRQLDVESLDELLRIMIQLGIDSKELKGYIAGEGKEVHDALQQSLHPVGIFGVPTYVLDGEVFFGREHLPMIRWLLNGENGPAPDIAYTLD